MALEKLNIRPLPPSQLEAFDVLFNPNSYTITKSVTWSPPESPRGRRASTQRTVNAPALQFGGGGSRQLSLELFFDVTEAVGDPPAMDVRALTNKVVALTVIERNLDRPPACELSWGQAPPNSDFPFVGVISSLTQKFTLFKSDGTPVRATLTVTFLEFLDAEQDRRRTDPVFTTRVVRRGDSLSSIAAEVYRDPKQWRRIAMANGIENPRKLEPGTRLSIPDA